MGKKNVKRLTHALRVMEKQVKRKFGTVDGELVFLIVVMHRFGLSLGEDFIEAFFGAARGEAEATAALTAMPNAPFLLGLASDFGDARERWEAAGSMTLEAIVDVAEAIYDRVGHVLEGGRR